MKFLTILIMIFLTLSPAAHAEPLTVGQFREALPENSKELDLEEFVALQKEGPVTVLDLRPEESFARRHLKGSLNAPLAELTEKTLPALAPDKDAPVVLACDYSFQPERRIAMTLMAYPVLKTNGYTKIYRLNLWKGGGDKMLSLEEMKQQLEFEGTEEAPVSSPEQPLMCTMEAKLCPDGSYVSRTGPHCAFAECPNSQ